MLVSVASYARQLQSNTTLLDEFNQWTASTTTLTTDNSALQQHTATSTFLRGTLTSQFSTPTVFIAQTMYLCGGVWSVSCGPPSDAPASSRSLDTFLIVLIVLSCVTCLLGMLFIIGYIWRKKKKHRIAPIHIQNITQQIQINWRDVDIKPMNGHTLTDASYQAHIQHLLHLSSAVVPQFGEVQCTVPQSFPRSASSSSLLHSHSKSGLFSSHLQQFTNFPTIKEEYQIRLLQQQQHNGTRNTSRVEVLEEKTLPPPEQLGIAGGTSSVSRTGISFTSYQRSRAVSDSADSGVPDLIDLAAYPPASTPSIHRSQSREYEHMQEEERMQWEYQIAPKQQQHTPQHIGQQETIHIPVGPHAQTAVTPTLTSPATIANVPQLPVSHPTAVPPQSVKLSVLPSLPMLSSVPALSTTSNPILPSPSSPTSAQPHTPFSPSAVQQVPAFPLPQLQLYRPPPLIIPPIASPSLNSTNPPSIPRTTKTRHTRTPTSGQLVAVKGMPIQRVCVPSSSPSNTAASATSPTILSPSSPFSGRDTSATSATEATNATTLADGAAVADTTSPVSPAVPAVPAFGLTNRIQITTTNAVHSAAANNNNTTAQSCAYHSSSIAGNETHLGITSDVTTATCLTMSPSSAQGQSFTPIASTPSMFALNLKPTTTMPITSPSTRPQPGSIPPTPMVANVSVAGLPVDTESHSALTVTTLTTPHSFARIDHPTGPIRLTASKTPHKQHNGDRK